MSLIDDRKCVEYQSKQFEKPKYSTIEFEKFLRENKCIRPNTRVLDIGAGGGDFIAFLAQKYPETRFLGVDYNKANVELGKKVMAEKGIKNVEMEAGDWFDLPESYAGKFDGILNVHTLCCFKRLDKALNALVELNPRWIAFNSLFYEGPLDVLIHIRDHTRPELKDDDPDADFNIFSLDVMRGLLAEGGYGIKFSRFNIPASLPRPEEGKRGTYTVKTEFDKRAQFSGPVYLPWYFVLAQKRK